MKAAQVLDRYYRLVPFPLTPEKIAAAGYDVDLFLSNLINELYQCEDRDLTPVKKTLSAIRQLTEAAGA